MLPRRFIAWQGELSEARSRKPFCDSVMQLSTRDVSSIELLEGYDAPSEKWLSITNSH